MTLYVRCRPRGQLAPRSAYPRRQLGPDVFKYFSDVAQRETGSRHGFRNCRVQADSDGQPLPIIDVEGLEILSDGHPDTYGQLITRTVLPMAERVELAFVSLDRNGKLKVLDEMLRRSQTTDPIFHWVLSTTALRKLVFPGSIDPMTGKRSDNVRYIHNAKDFHAGKLLALPNLSPEVCSGFAKEAQRLINQPMQAAALTPAVLAPQEKTHA